MRTFRLLPIPESEVFSPQVMIASEVVTAADLTPRLSPPLSVFASPEFQRAFRRQVHPACEGGDAGDACDGRRRYKHHEECTCSESQADPASAVCGEQVQGADTQHSRHAARDALRRRRRSPDNWVRRKLREAMRCFRSRDSLKQAG